MRNKNKIFVLISIIVLLLVVGLYLSHKNKKDTYFKTQKDRIDLYFKYNLKGYHSMKITKFEKNPMGGFFVDGYINNDKKFDFIATMNEEKDFQFDDEINYSKKLSHLFKQKSTSNKFPSQIIKEKNLNENDYKADPPFIFGF